jgi:hypothetical protein
MLNAFILSVVAPFQGPLMTKCLIKNAEQPLKSLISFTARPGGPYHKTYCGRNLRISVKS